MKSQARLIFTGFFEAVHFLEFIDQRARRLDLSVRIDTAGADRIAVRVVGQLDLVDAFEMACSLGPLDCLVRDVRREDIAVETEAADEG